MKRVKRCVVIGVIAQAQLYKFGHNVQLIDILITMDIIERKNHVMRFVRGEGQVCT